MTFYELYQMLDEKFPRELSCEWDNDGIMCADDFNAPVKRVLIALDVTDETIDYAEKNGFDTIISHHPLVFKAQKALTIESFVQAKLIRLIRSSIRVMSFHTRLDAGDGGVNDALACALELSVIEHDPVEPIGRICVLESELELGEFCKHVKACLGAPYISFVGDSAVKRVYLCGGDGKDMIKNAIDSGADTLLTGNASYNSMLDAQESGLNVIEAGHFYTENPVCKFIKVILDKSDTDIYTEVFNSNKIKVI